MDINKFGNEKTYIFKYVYILILECLIGELQITIIYYF